jgi:hypothetical protein
MSGGLTGTAKRNRAPSFVTPHFRDHDQSRRRGSSPNCRPSVRTGRSRRLGTWREAATLVGVKRRRVKTSKAPRQPWHLRHRRQFRICKLQIQQGLTGFESHPLRHIKTLVKTPIILPRPFIVGQSERLETVTNVWRRRLCSGVRSGWAPSNKSRHHTVSATPLRDASFKMETRLTTWRWHSATTRKQSHFITAPGSLSGRNA